MRKERQSNCKNEWVNPSFTKYQVVSLRSHKSQIGEQHVKATSLEELVLSPNIESGRPLHVTLDSLSLETLWVLELTNGTAEQLLPATKLTPMLH
jgi:hypothetical protein